MSRALAISARLIAGRSARTSGLSIALFSMSPRSPPVSVHTRTSTPSDAYLAIVAAPLLDSSSGWACTAISRSCPRREYARSPPGSGANVPELTTNSSSRSSHLALGRRDTDDLNARDLRRHSGAIRQRPRPMARACAPEPHVFEIMFEYLAWAVD